MAVTTMIGAKIHRREDPRLVSGEGGELAEGQGENQESNSSEKVPAAHRAIHPVKRFYPAPAPTWGWVPSSSGGTKFREVLRFSKSVVTQFRRRDH